MSQPMVKVKIVGMEEMSKLLHIMPDEVKMKALNLSLRDVGRRLHYYAVSGAPEKSGALKRGIRLIKAKRTEGPWHVAYGLGVRTARAKTRRMGFLEGALDRARVKAKGPEDPYYWFFVEFGSVHNKPEKPFLRNAMEAHRDEHLASFKALFTQRLDGVAKKLYGRGRLPAYASMSALR
jgi:HK97 gp10 family phage protein